MHIIVFLLFAYLVSCQDGSLSNIQNRPPDRAIVESSENLVSCNLQYYHPDMTQSMRIGGFHINLSEQSTQNLIFNTESLERESQDFQKLLPNSEIRSLVNDLTIDILINTTVGLSFLSLSYEANKRNGHFQGFVAKPQHVNSEAEVNSPQNMQTFFFFVDIEDGTDDDSGAAEINMTCS